MLTGQDGFSPDQARGFAPTPQEFLFGVCASASTDPHCTVDPSTVPKAVDVLAPPGVLQSDELDYTVHQPVTIQAECGAGRWMARPVWCLPAFPQLSRPFAGPFSGAGRVALGHHVLGVA